MKRCWIEYLLVAFMVACGSGPSQLFATTVSGALSYTYSATSQVDANNNWPACTATITTECVTGFNVYDTTGSTPVLLGKVPNSQTPSGAQTMTFTFTATGLAYGTNTAVETTAYIGSGGTSAESADSAPATFTVPAPGSPGPPAIISLTAK